MPTGTFDLTRFATTTTGRLALGMARPLLARGLGLTTLQALYRRLPDAGPDLFADLALDALQVTLACPRADLARIPARGPVIVVANHPHGALDGLALAALVRRVRPDVRLLANRWLAAIPQLAATCFFVDPFGGREAAERSRAGLRAAHLWLRSGGVLIVFPAGEVAHRATSAGTPGDGAWNATVGRLAMQAGATLVPVRIEGRNSRAFYRLGRLHKRLRTVLLARELLAKRGSTIAVRVGQPWQPERDQEPWAVTAAARARVDGMGEGEPPVAREVAGLPASACLVTAGDFRVYCAPADLIPHTLREIGRLREDTYRSIGEGTGAAIDLDRFDLKYLHLFSWDTRTQQVVGAYRLGRADRLVARDGVAGLYTRTLFAYERALLDRWGPSLELGRAFVRAEYQRHHSALLLLWKGICRFVALHPEYRVLFGPVSVSPRYSAASHQLLMSFLEAHHFDPALAALVTPSRPPVRCDPPADARQDLTSSGVVDRAVAAAEGDGRGMPVLLRHYLKLGARLLAFNVDPAFGHALDALMMVDLTKVDRHLLDRYFGPEEASRYLAGHADRRVGHAA